MREERRGEERRGEERRGEERRGEERINQATRQNKDKQEHMWRQKQRGAKCGHSRDIYKLEGD